MSALFTGLSVALATPFHPGGRLDLPAFRRLVRHVVDGGTDTLVVLGTTGESPTLDEDERDALIRACLEEASGRPVVAGTGSNNTRQAAAWTRKAQDLGVSGALVVTPYYNKPTPAGLVAHYQAISEAAPGLPLVAYNVPGRTGCTLTPPVMARLWELPALAALKESTGSSAQMGELARTLPPGRTLLSGDDHMTLPAIALGAEGLVSVAGNVVPAEMKALVDAARAGRLAEARALHQRLLPLMDALFAESNPIPLKAALAMVGLASDTLRLPLTPAEPATRARLATALEAVSAGVA